jgi:membrane associated rhomboid family serine protease
VAFCDICGKKFELKVSGGYPAEGIPTSRCPECTAKNLGPTPEPRKRPPPPAAQFAVELKRIAPGRPVATWGLIAICAGVFIIEVAKGAGFESMPISLALKLGADYGPLTISGQWWRMLTSMFLHFGAIHLAMNMWCLFVLGALSERLMGRAAFLVLYFATGLAGSLLSLAVHPEIVSAGASGAVFGVTGGLVTYLWMKKAPVDFAKVKPQLRSLGIFVAYNILYSLRPGVDLMAHAGGFVAGLLIGAALPRFLEVVSPAAIPTSILEQGTGPKRVGAVAVGCAVLLLLGVAALRHFEGDSAYVIGSLSQIDAGHSADVIPTLEKIVGRQPSSGIAHYALGAAYLRTGRPDDSVRELEKAVQLDPNDVDFKAQLDDANRVAAGRKDKVSGK